MEAGVSVSGPRTNPVPEWIVTEPARPRHRGRSWSFSDEWKAHFDSALDRTWGWSLEERVQQFFLETQVDAESCPGMRILDAGCGNGQLTEALAAFGATVVGLDYSSSVFEAEHRRTRPNVHFLQGDLQQIPFSPGSFDLVISNGVIHHTPDAHRCFGELARSVKDNGRLYVWLYKRPDKGLRRTVLYPALDFSRAVVSRLPGPLQSFVVRAYAHGLLARHSVRRKHKDLNYAELVVEAYDLLTPRWRTYHTPVELSGWFHEHGFAPAVLSHWDNPYGFGMVGVKGPAGKTPGVHFGATA